MIGVGSSVWVYDPNSRVYAPGSRAPTERGYWKAQTIVEDGRSSWTTAQGVKIIKKHKHTARAGGFGGYEVLFSEQDVNDRCYLAENRYRVIELLRGCRNAAAFRIIAGILEAN